MTAQSQVCHFRPPACSLCAFFRRKLIYAPPHFWRERGVCGEGVCGDFVLVSGSLVGSSTPRSAAGSVSFLLLATTAARLAWGRSAARAVRWLRGAWDVLVGRTRPLPTRYGSLCGEECQPPTCRDRLAAFLLLRHTQHTPRVCLAPGCSRPHPPSCRQRCGARCCSCTTHCGTCQGRQQQQQQWT
jgi:hypothetical protein